MKNALITGATGFLGGHVVRELTAAGYRLHAITRADSDRRRLQEQIPSITFSDSEHLSVEELFATRSFEEVVLLAASYGRGGERPSETLRANVVFPLTLLEQAIATKVPTVIHADTCFTPDYKYLRSYTLSKKQFVQWGRLLSEGTTTRFINLVLQHPYGPGDRPGKFVPDMIQECLQSTCEIALTPGGQKKDFIYVGDVAAAFRILLEKASTLPPGAVELECGTGSPVSIREFVETIHRLTNSRATLRFGALPYRENEIMISRANPAKLQSLGWQPRVSLEEGLRMTLREDFGRG